MNRLEVQPLGPPGFAAEIVGIDVGRPDEPDLHAQLRSALARHPVLCIRTGGLVPEQLVAIASAFGVPRAQVLRDHRLEACPVVSVVSSEQFDVRGDGRRIVFGGAWHTDDSYLPRPAAVTALHAVELPSAGGDTFFADCRAAYEHLPDTWSNDLADVEIVHAYSSRRNLNPVPARTREEEEESPPATHRLVKWHPVTGRAALYLNPNRMDHVVGLPLAEGDALLDRLIDHATSDRFVYRHQWRRNDLVVWDNRCTMHRASDDYTGRRLMHRVLLAAEEHLEI